MARFFTTKTFRFLKDLTANNEREWFKANQERYETDVREPALDFITEFAAPLVKLSPHFVADPRKVGGSLFRIQRDTRFSKDKTPYKTGLGIQFRHVATKGDVHAPGFYLHIEPAACYAGVGLWRPATPDALKIRSAISENSAGWKKAAYGTKFTEMFERSGDALKRPPRGFDPEHKYLEDLKMKDFIAGTNLTQRMVTGEDFLGDYTALCRTSAPFMRFLCEAVGVGF